MVGTNYIMAEVGCGDASEGDCYPPPDGLEATAWVGSFPRAFRLKLVLSILNPELCSQELLRNMIRIPECVSEALDY